MCVKPPSFLAICVQILVIIGIEVLGAMRIKLRSGVACFALVFF